MAGTESQERTQTLNSKKEKLHHFMEESAEAIKGGELRQPLRRSVRLRLMQSTLFPPQKNEVIDDHWNSGDEDNDFIGSSSQGKKKKKEEKKKKKKETPPAKAKANASGECVRVIKAFSNCFDFD